MRISMLWIAIPILVLGIPALAQETAEDEAAIDMLTDKFTEAWANGDAKAIAALYAVDADRMEITGVISKGREEIETNVAEILSMYEGSQVKIERTSPIRFIKPNIAVWDGTWEIIGAPEVEGEPPPTKGAGTVVAVKQNGQWLCAADRSRVPAAPPSTGQQ